MNTKHYHLFSPCGLYKYGQLLTYALKRPPFLGLGALSFWHLPTFAWFCFTTRLPCSLFGQIRCPPSPASIQPPKIQPPLPGAFAPRSPFCFCAFAAGSEVLFEAHTFVQHGSRLVAVLSASYTQKPPAPAPAPAPYTAARAPSALFLQEIKYFCVARQTKWRCLALHEQGGRSANTQDEGTKGPTDDRRRAAAKTAPCLQSFAVKKLKNKVK